MTKAQEKLRPWSEIFRGLTIEKAEWSKDDKAWVFTMSDKSVMLVDVLNVIRP